jgi:hypothetical protein
MRIAIMQPYLLPYIGYFQLINCVDKFVVYDNIQYSKKGWINRNRILVNGRDDYFTIPLKKDSDFLNVDQRFIADSYAKEKNKIITRINELYKKAPQYQIISPLIAEVFNAEFDNLFEFILNSLKKICAFLEIKTELILSSEISIDHSLKAQDKVIALCKKLNATHYLNPIGGTELYSKSVFKENNIELNFIKSNDIEYPQFNYDFMPWLSIIDVLFFNSKQDVQQFLNSYTIH